VLLQLRALLDVFDQLLSPKTADTIRSPHTWMATAAGA
jgi:hypothetical protein